MAISCSQPWRKSVDMEICRQADALQISDLDPFLAELLRQIPESADAEGAPEAEARLFSKPSAEKEMCAEWESYVEPELRRIFRSATQTVAADLAQLNGNEKSLRNRTLRIPLEHADAWLNTLNQARLVIATVKINNDLERMGDLAVSIAKRVISLAGMPPVETPSELIAMAEPVSGLLSTWATLAADDPPPRAIPTQMDRAMTNSIIRRRAWGLLLLLLNICFLHRVT